MPKILRNNIRDAIIKSAFGCIIGWLAVLVLQGTRSGAVKEWYGCVVGLWLVFLVSGQDRKDMPEYLFLAPYTGEERKTLMCKIIGYKILGEGICGALFVLPGVVKNDEVTKSGIVLIVAAMLIGSCMVQVLIYFEKFYPMRFVWCVMITRGILIIPSGFELVIDIVCILVLMGRLIYYYVRYFPEMLENYTCFEDWENSK